MRNIRKVPTGCWRAHEWLCAYHSWLRRSFCFLCCVADGFIVKLIDTTMVKVNKGLLSVMRHNRFRRREMGTPVLGSVEVYELVVFWLPPRGNIRPSARTEKSRSVAWGESAKKSVNCLWGSMKTEPCSSRVTHNNLTAFDRCNIRTRLLAKFYSVCTSKVLCVGNV